MAEPQLHQATPAELKARLEAERRGTPFLLFTDDAGPQQIFDLDAHRGGRVIVGRGAGSSFATPATNRQIAEELFLSVDAGKTHLRALTLKFGIQDLPQNRKRARLVELALQNGEISERDLEAGG